MFFLLLQGAFKDVFSNNPLFVSMIRVFFCNLFCFKLIYGFAIYKLITSKTKKQTNLNEKKNRRNKNCKPTPLAELPSPLELSKIKNILLLHRVCNPFWGFLRATVFFSGKRYGWSLAMFRRAPMRHQSFWIPTNMLSPIRSGGEKLTSP